MALIVVVQNTTELAAVSDYQYDVLVTTRNTETGDIGEKLIARGTVKQHPRAEGWAALLQRLLDQRDDNDVVPLRARVAALQSWAGTLRLWAATMTDGESVEVAAGHLRDLAREIEGATNA